MKVNEKLYAFDPMIMIMSIKVILMVIMIVIILLMMMMITIVWGNSVPYDTDFDQQGHYHDDDD